MMVTMTTQREARQRANILMNQHDLFGWSFGFDNAKARAGCTHGSLRKITLSRHFVAANGMERIEQTILHEIAHALVGTGHGHDAVWKAKAKEIGHTGDRLYKAADTVMPERSWIGTCACGEWTRHRLTQRMRTATCAGCGMGITWRHR